MNFSNYDVALLPAQDDVTISGDQSRLQSAILASLCRGNNFCNFEITRQENAFTPAHPVGNAVRNPGDGVVHSSDTYVDTESQTTSISVTAKVGVNISSMVNTAIAATYGHSWTETHTFKQKVEFDVQPWQEAWVTAEQPVYRVHGNFTVEFWGTTFHLHDAVFDTPNPNEAGVYTVHRKPIPEPIEPVDP
ncbi:hypothetical protein [Mycolicibacterium sp. XJ1819]